MTFLTDLLAPLALLFGGHADAPPPPAEPPVLDYVSPVVLRADAPDYASWKELAQSFRSQSQNQVRIEQRVTIRVIPHPSRQVNLLAMVPNGDASGDFVEKKMGKYVPVSGIAGVQANGASNLILFMRDQRMVSAALERSCRARDFYSGFYLERSSDGKLCVDRDTLLSRNGANCKLTRIRQLVLKDD